MKSFIKIIILNILMLSTFTAHANAALNQSKIEINEISFQINRYNKESGRWINFYIKNDNHFELIC